MAMIGMVTVLVDSHRPFEKTMNPSHDTHHIGERERLTLLRAWLDHDYDRCRNFCLSLEGLVSRETVKIVPWISAGYLSLLRRHLITYLDFCDPCKHL